MTSIVLNKELPEEFFSDILITAFDGTYGSSWQWFEPAPLADKFWLKTKNDTGHDSVVNPWMSVRVRLRSECQTGYVVFDTREGFVLDHQAIAGGISRIVNDDYVGVWRAATPEEVEGYLDGSSHRDYRETEHGLEVGTGETAGAYRSIVVAAVMDPEGADIDADVADAIVQVAAFGKCIFG